jgi:two-component system sensor histidine kinase AgrC
MDQSTIWLFIELAANLFESLILFAVLDTFLERKHNRSLFYHLAPFLHAGMISLINILGFDMLISTGILITLSLIYAVALYRAKWRNALMLMVTYHAVWFMFELCTVLVLGLMFTISMEDIFQQNLYRLTGIIVSKTFQFILLKVIQQYRFKIGGNIHLQKWFHLFLFPISTLVTTLSWYYLGRFSYSSQLFLVFAVSSLILLFSNLFIFNLFEADVRVVEEKHSQELIALHTDYDLDKLHQLHESKNQLRQLQHDLRNKLYPLVFLIKQEKKTEALDYVYELSDLINMDGKVVESGNEYLDALINQKIHHAAAAGINITCQLDDCTNLDLPADDLCVIIGNAIDNAIEACQRNKSPEMKQVSFELHRNNGKVTITISNSTETQPIVIDGKYISSKRDQKAPGIGLRSIQQLVSKLKGQLNLKTTSGEFCCQITLEDVTTAES